MIGGAGTPQPAQPVVSLVMPCRNEERFVGDAIRSLLDGTFPLGQLELIVVDGRSSDRTPQLLAEIARCNPTVRVLDNARGVTPVGLNLGIRAARGRVVIRVDAHATYPPEYIAELVRTLDETGAEQVGGILEYVSSDGSPIAEAIRLAIGSSFGTASRFRYQRRGGPVDTVAFGCWRRELFDRLGHFDERLLRNQDNEFASRILRSGGLVYQTASTSIQYHGRSSLRSLWRQASETGMWNAFTQRLHPYTFRWRHFLPGPFFVAVIAAAALLLGGVLLGGPAGALLAGCSIALVLPYALANVAASGRIALGARSPLLWPVVSFVLASYHIAYGFGITKGWLLVATRRWRRQLGGAPLDAGR